MLTEKDLQGLQWNDISITRNNLEGEFILIVLMFPNAELGTSFLDTILRKNAFTFGVINNKNTNNYSFVLDFLQTDFVARLDSTIPVSKIDYSEWFNKGIPAYITTGFWKEGNFFEYNKDIKNLDEVNLN